MQGWWVADEDSLARVEVLNTSWIWYYDDGSAALDDTSVIQIRHHLPKCANPSVSADFVNLIQGTDTLPYELVGLTDSTLSLMYCIRGNFILYRKLWNQ